MICPVHNLMMTRDSTGLRWYCEWPGCTETKADMEVAVSESRKAPTSDINELFNGIRYEDKSRGSTHTIKAYLPPGFSQSEYTYIFDENDALGYKMSINEYAEWNRRMMFEELIRKINKDRF